MSAPIDIRNLFGFPDAARATDEEILAEHLGRLLEPSLKCGSRPTGRSIIVGIKGSGKTDLRRYIQETDRSKAVVLNLNCDTGFFNLDVRHFDMKSGRLKNALALQLLGVFAEAIPSSGSKVSKLLDALRDAAGTVGEVAKKVGLATEIDLRFATLDLSKLAATEHTGFIESTREAMANNIDRALSDSRKRGYILIDDVEDVFPGIEENPNFVEGLARAVSELNRRFGSRLHVLLFLKYGIWRQWFEHPREYDKVESEIEILSWGNADLIALIAKRVAIRRGLSPTEDDKVLWAAAFDFEDSFEGFTGRFTSVCVNGPRDMVDLCNRCGETAGGGHVNVGHLEKVLLQYSEAKLNAVGADFGDVYPDVQLVAKQVLQGVPAIFRASWLADRFEQRLVSDDRLYKAFGHRRWFGILGSAEFPFLMYKIGIVGIVEQATQVYALEDPRRTVRFDDEMVVHPAFRPYLGVVDGRE